MKEYPKYCKYPRVQIEAQSILEDCWSLLEAPNEQELNKVCQNCKFNITGRTKWEQLNLNKRLILYHIIKAWYIYYMIEKVWTNTSDNTNYAQTTIDNELFKLVYDYIIELKKKDKRNELSYLALIRCVRNNFAYELSFAKAKELTDRCLEKIKLSTGSL